MDDNGISAHVFWQRGAFALTDTVVTTWGIMLVLFCICFLISHRLKNEPALLQTAAEGVVLAAENAVKEVLPDNYQTILPFILTLWVFLVFANLAGIIPGLHSPTRDLSCTSGLAILVFFSTHWYGIRIEGLKNYLKHYLKLGPFMLPFELISEVSRTIALAVRLFGNMMSMELIALLLLIVAGFLVPVPLLLLHIIEAFLQAYIFGMLALIYIAGGIQSQQLTGQKEEE